MGHVRLGRLPQTRKWQHVVGLLGSSAPIEEVAAASAVAAESTLRDAIADPALTQTVWLLTQLPLAARSANFEAALRGLGLRIHAEPRLLDLVGAVSEAVDRHAARVGGRTDLGELAQQAGAESLTAIVGRTLPSLFMPTPEEVRKSLGRLAAKERYGELARDFFASLIRRYLDYYLSRELSQHVGPQRRLPTITVHVDFNQALELHCREASRIVQDFAGSWYTKAQFEGGITPERARRFAFVALRKIVAELKRRSGRDG
jgi:hypothetical protein